MAFTTEVKVDGDSDTYQMSPEVKKYTLRDVGFTVSNGGNFIYERSLDPTSPYKQGNKLKVTFAKDLSGFKMSVTTANGLKRVNIFNKENDKPLVEQYHYILDDMVERQIFVKA
ncbi:DUF1831 domain-containing protein [Pediococcus inopinatus]|uniref:DUF1831 domain-containing protein n=1 Tax=Pediococcus inopinatus TaxID=114090 RepID=A0ABZ0Q250_9LACO|nr:DUF1831 domain-containing protein [Pediococcus inopinatus]AVL00111.1 cysteine desulfurase [Pediococcus inopinatus]KRN62698.1 hypothetical protein IV83_GL001981 [Pediococcus inopinatus]WPC17830.1 DUF1831 domain-containing protein [Pediococcus inopinatus]WPC19218.1 DUF1831 domain-containing protein [Pediococcus inopinatus]WPC21009.1 DUF1831 domain-containing protein [Pediococcus inopinatus]